MIIQITSQHMTVGDPLKQRIETKLHKFDRYFGEDAQAQVKTRTEGETDKRVEITVRVKKHLYRAEAQAQDVFSALDTALNNLERQIRKQKSKIEKKIRDYAYLKEALRDAPQEETPEESQIIRKKQFPLHPMNEEEAALQMELLGHAFHLFLNGQTGKVALIYKRRDGHYGLIEPEY